MNNQKKRRSEAVQKSSDNEDSTKTNSLKNGFLLISFDNTIKAVPTGFRRKTFSDKNLNRKRQTKPHLQGMREIVQNYCECHKLSINNVLAKTEDGGDYDWNSTFRGMYDAMGSEHIGDDVARKNNKFVAYIYA